MLKRGDFLKPDKIVAPGVPAALHSLPDDAAPTRLSFARWLVDRRSPTAARAAVNRVWQAYFGVGLVSTSEDLGTQAEPPTHPELLDWLAVEFMDRGWSLKELHRLIVASATYRQSSHVSAAPAGRTNPQTIDPSNRFLWRGPRLRVEAEVVRDIALAASGLLNPRVGGPSVFPPLPSFMLQPPVSYGPKVWPEDTGPDRYRRGLYTFRFRSLPYPALETFDAPAGDAACVRRARSNTPLQALVTLNEPLAVETARALGRRAVREGGTTDAERLTYAFRLCVSRPPTEPERSELVSLFQKQVERFSQPGARPADVSGDATDGDLARAAAWTVVARVLLNLDETITKE